MEVMLGKAGRTSRYIPRYTRPPYRPSIAPPVPPSAYMAQSILDPAPCTSGTDLPALTSLESSASDRSAVRS